MNILHDYAISIGANPKELEDDYFSAPESEQMALMSHIMQVGGQAKPSTEDLVISIIVNYAKSTGQDPKAILEEFSQMSEEEQAQALQVMKGDEQEDVHNSQEEQLETQQRGGYDKRSILGYSDKSPYRFDPSNLIKSNNITMDDTGIDLMGISDTGDTQFMPAYSGQYNFKGKNVLEVPVYQTGPDKAKFGKLLKLGKVQLDSMSYSDLLDLALKHKGLDNNVIVELAGLTRRELEDYNKKVEESQNKLRDKRKSDKETNLVGNGSSQEYYADLGKTIGKILPKSLPKYNTTLSNFPKGTYEKALSNLALADDYLKKVGESTTTGKIGPKGYTIQPLPASTFKEENSVNQKIFPARKNAEGVWDAENRDIVGESKDFWGKFLTKDRSGFTKNADGTYNKPGAKKLSIPSGNITVKGKNTNYNLSQISANDYEDQNGSLWNKNKAGQFIMTDNVLNKTNADKSRNLGNISSGPKRGSSPRGSKYFPINSDKNEWTGQWEKFLVEKGIMDGDKKYSVDQIDELVYDYVKNHPSEFGNNPYLKDKNLSTLLTDGVYGKVHESFTPPSSRIDFGDVQPISGRKPTDIKLDSRFGKEPLTPNSTIPYSPKIDGITPERAPAKSMYKFNTSSVLGDLINNYKVSKAFEPIDLPYFEDTDYRMPNAPQYDPRPGLQAIADNFSPYKSAINSNSTTGQAVLSSLATKELDAMQEYMNSIEQQQTQADYQGELNRADIYNKLIVGRQAARGNYIDNVYKTNANRDAIIDSTLANVQQQYYNRGLEENAYQRMLAFNANLEDEASILDNILGKKKFSFNKDTAFKTNFG